MKICYNFLITFGNFGERFELLAMKAAGISLLKIMRPLIIFISEQTQAPDSCLHEKSEKAFKYTWRDIYIFAKLRNINLSDTTHVSINQYIDGQKGIPVWEIDIRDSIQPDMARVILIHGETGEVMMDSYE